MIGAVSDHHRERLLAVGAAVFAGSLIAGARGIEDSMLSDAVGAGGVPQGVGIAIAVAATALFAKSYIGATPSRGDGPAGTPVLPVLLRTAALVLVLLAYGALLPWLGYPLTVSLLVGASGWLAGAAPGAPLLACTLLSGPGLWLLFDRLLQVRMPVGSLWG